jgi:YD repeat-containing protein
MRYAYDGRLLVQETDRNGFSFYWRYDGRAASARCVRTAGDGGVFNQKLDYDPKGGVTVVTDSFGNRTLYKVNEIGLVVRKVAPDGAVTETTYNDVGKPIEETDALGNATRWSYDRFGHVSVTTYADGTKTICKRSPQFPELVTMFQNEAGAIWRNRFDDHGQLVEAKAPEGGVTSLDWRDGLLRAVVAPGGRRFEYAYDRQANLSAVQLPNGADVRYEHDRRGRRTAVVNVYGGREQFAYDLRRPDRASRDARSRRARGDLRSARERRRDARSDERRSVRVHRLQLAGVARGRRRDAGRHRPLRLRRRGRADRDPQREEPALSLRLRPLPAACPRDRIRRASDRIQA